MTALYRLLIRLLSRMRLKANRGFYRQYLTQGWVPAYPSTESGKGGLYMRCMGNTSFYHELRCN